MRLRVIAVSGSQPAWVEAGVADYARRLPPQWPLELLQLKPARRSSSRDIASLLAEEAERIEAHLGRQTALIVCDERGQALTSQALAEALARWQQEYRQAAFVIGSADGTDPVLRAKATACLGLSRLTLPHGLAKLVLVEQLYRAVSILAGRPYHRD
jgi:Uncharacterized conserved protein